MPRPRHWLAILLTAALGGCASSSGSTGPSSKSATEAESAPTVSGREARALVADGAVLLDVRSSAEYAIRHLEGAENIPVGELEDRLDELDPDTPVVVYCMSGHRSAEAGRILRSEGFDEVYDLGSIFSY